MFNRVSNCRHGAIDTDLRHALGSERPRFFVGWNENGRELREVASRKDLVISEARVGHPPLFIEEVLFSQGVGDAVEHCTLHLALREGRVDRCAAINSGHVLQDLDETGLRVDLDTREVCRERRW